MTLRPEFTSIYTYMYYYQYGTYQSRMDMYVIQIFPYPDHGAPVCYISPD